MDCISLPTHHVYSTLKQRGNDRFHVVSTWNTCDVFVEMEAHRQLVLYSYHHFVFEWSDGKLIDFMLKQKNKLGMRLSLHVKSRISVLPNFISFNNLQHSNPCIYFRLWNFSDAFVFTIQSKTSFVSLHRFHKVLSQLTFSVFVNHSASTKYIRNNKKIEDIKKKYQNF